MHHMSLNITRLISANKTSFLPFPTATIPKLGYTLTLEELWGNADSLVLLQNQWNQESLGVRRCYHRWL